MAKEISKLFVVLGLDDSGFQKSLDSVQKTLTNAGKMMTGLGASITAGLGLSVKAAEEDRQSQMRLAAAMKNVGVNYDDVKDSLNGVIDATMKKTGFSDDDQRAALTELIITTGDYQKALDLLPTALDLAAATQTDVTTSAETLGKANEDIFRGLNQLGIKYDSTTTSADALKMIQDKVKGSAEQMASPFSVLKNTFTEVEEKIGSKLLPVLQKIIDFVTPIIEKIGDWIDRNPTLATTLLTIAGAVGGLMVVVGPLLMALPLLAAGFTMMLGPVGLVVAAVALVAAGAVLLIENWDKIVDFFKGLWDDVKNAFTDAWNSISDFFTGIWDGIKNTFTTAWDDIIDFFKQIPDKIGEAFGVVKDIILAPFRLAWHGIEEGVNWVIRMLNKIHFSFPDWVPFVGGKEFGINIPEISLPEFHTGGVVPGRPGQEVPILAKAGEIISQPGKAGGITNTFNLYGMVVREEADVQRIARELYHMQQARI